jgi:ethanolamine ammonia-lyase small subunit
VTLFGRRLISSAI